MGRLSHRFSNRARLTGLLHAWLQHVCRKFLTGTPVEGAITASSFRHYLAVFVPVPPAASVASGGGLADLEVVVEARIRELTRYR